MGCGSTASQLDFGLHPATRVFEVRKALVRRIDLIPNRCKSFNPIYGTRGYISDNECAPQYLELAFFAL